MKKLLLLLLIINFVNTKAQDVIFSQSFLVPETLSSSFTGATGYAKTGVLRRSQKTNYGGNVNSNYGYYDTWFDRYNSGLGISILNQQETNSSYSFNQLNLNYSIVFKLSKEWFFRPSISVGYGMKSFGFQNLLLGDQIDIATGIIGLTSDPLAFGNKRSFFDFSSSILFNNDYTWIGVTLKHLNKPNISLTSNDNVPLDIFLSVHMKYNLPFIIGNSPWFTSQSEIYLLSNFMMQGISNRLDIGLQYIFDNKISFGLVSGLSPFRKLKETPLVSTINSFVGVKWKNFRFGYSYDLNTTKLLNNGGIHEFSIAYDFNLNIRGFFM